MFSLLQPTNAEEKKRQNNPRKAQGSLSSSMDYGAREMIRIISKAAARHSHAVQKSCFVFKDNFLSIYKRESEYSYIKPS